MPTIEEPSQGYEQRREPHVLHVLRFRPLRHRRLVARTAPEAVLDKAKSFTGPLALGAPSLQCGKYADAPAVCNDQAQFFNYEGQFARVSGWLRPPTS